ncbi:MAG: Fic family protein [Thermoplasmata archaeon]|nr:Fic family protein [Thermoplasmata archaeon]
MNSVDPRFVSRMTLGPEHVASLRVIGEYKGKQEIYIHQSPEALETLRMLATVESVESSNRLEGVVAKRPRIEGMVLRSANPEGKSEQEIAGYRDALSLVHENWGTLGFTEGTISRLHRLVFRYLPERGGTWKVMDNFIIERYPDGGERIRFRPTPAKETPVAMSHLVERYDALVRAGEDPLITIPLAVFDFLCIHPFDNGNGRLARLLTLLLLYRAGYIVGRYISLERIFEETKETYYETLEGSSRKWHSGDHDIMPWLTYFWGVLIRAYREFEARVGTVTTGYGSKTEQIKLAVDRRTGPFAISDIERECPGISRDMIRHVLRQLRDELRIRSTGVGRGAKWIKVPGKWK